MRSQCNVRQQTEVRSASRYRRSWDTRAMNSEAVTRLSTRSLRLTVTCNGDSDLYRGHAKDRGCQNKGEDSPGVPIPGLSDSRNNFIDDGS